MKSGWKTSEFWVTVMAVLPVLFQLAPPKDLPYLAAIAAVYTAARSVIKAVHAAGLWTAVQDLPELPAVVADTLVVADKVEMK